MFIRDRQERYITRGDGKLILRPSAARLTDKYGTPSFAAVRQSEFEYTAEAEMDFSPKENGDEAGLAVYLTPQNNYRICKKYENGKIYITVSKIADDFLQEIYRKEAADGRLKFRVDADRQKYRFMYSVNGDEYINAGEASAKFLTTDVADRCFTGTVIGVYTEAENETTAEAVVFSYKWFKNN